jgi:hypothetical protein
MNKAQARANRFQFVIDELWSLRPTIRKSFGLTFVYIDDKLLLALRDSIKQPDTNGVWLFTTTEHLTSLKREFPSLPRQNFWKSKDKAWVIIASKLEEFEENTFRACELILNADRRIGRPTRAALTTSRKKANQAASW